MKLNSRTGADIDVLTLEKKEKAAIDALLDEVLVQHPKIECTRFVDNCWLFAKRLPDRVLHFLHEHKYNENKFGVAIVKGYEVNGAGIGYTPDLPNSDTQVPSRTYKEEALLVLLSTVVGDIIAWSSQRGGALINDIIPVKGNEHEQLSTGSESKLEWHIEEAFHPYRPDNLALLCLRNTDRTRTTFASVCNIELEEEIKKVLFEPRFQFLTDKNFTAMQSAVNPPASVLFGNFDKPYLRIDPAFMAPLPGDDEASWALAAIFSQINEGIVEVSLEPGDYCFIDNYRAVHGRKSFVPRYDGQDRWLKRVLVTRDLRKSRDARPNYESRVIITD